MQKALLISILLPLRWAAIRDTFHRKLEDHVREELEKVYQVILEILQELTAA